MEEPPNTTRERIAFIAQGKGAQVPDQTSQLLKVIFDAGDYLDTLRRYPEPQRYVDGLYQIYCTVALPVEMRGRCFRALRKAGSETGFLPSSYRLSYEPSRQDALANAAGGFSDVWKATSPSGTALALKIIRVTQADDISEMRKRFCKEVLVAKHVTDPNVLAIVGVQMSDPSDPPNLCIVSPWMDNGNMSTYLRSTDGEGLDRVKLLLGVTRGLNYLHSIQVVHGDLKSSNILIDSDENPRLTDFGFSSITMNNISANASTPNGKGSTRWFAPELLELSTKTKGREKTKSLRVTFKSDTYSLAMVTIEIFTGRLPFDEYHEHQVILLLAEDKRPDKPVHPQFTPKLWSLTNKCWAKNPKRRPNIIEVLRELEAGDRTGRNIYGLIAASVSAFFAF
ncbi:kinase-like domain-containing protein [Thelephora terrestris]|uniref:Kinase-like domain-containing protein n=1 Tax=Thelephora terrestris TaxID=56493 RepID=A0A9P6HNP0_9AGAM|nr:kinase-like domain-containing protein [Thelephora terrestris]